MQRGLFSVFVALAGAMAIGACADDGGGGGQCSDGATEACTCPGGESGVRVCSGGAFGSCRGCAGGGDVLAPDTSVADATVAPDTFPPDTDTIDTIDRSVADTPDTSPPEDTTIADTSPPEDTTIADTSPPEDTTIADTAETVADTSDTNVADTSPPEDTTIADTADTTVPDTTETADTAVADTSDHELPAAIENPCGPDITPSGSLDPSCWVAGTFGGHEYANCNNISATWCFAIGLCGAWGGTIAMPGSPEENAFIDGLITFRAPFGLWLGFTDMVAEGTYLTAAGDPVLDQYWCEGEPDGLHPNGDPDCAVMVNEPLGGFGGCWRDLPCTLLTNFICER